MQDLHRPEASSDIAKSLKNPAGTTRLIENKT